MPFVSVQLAISADELLQWYEGRAHTVRATTVDGRTVRFPANLLRPFVTLDGVHGRFRIEFDRDNRFVGIQRERQSLW